MSLNKKDPLIPQTKRLAMGDTLGFAKGGSVPKLVPLPQARGVLRSGQPDSPLEGAKRANGIVGLKGGGSAGGITRAATKMDGSAGSSMGGIKGGTTKMDRAPRNKPGC